MIDIAAIAVELLDAYDHGKLIPSIAERDPGFDWSAAYVVAAEIARLRRARGEHCVGRKIGFTNRNIWPEYGATAPIWAHVYDSTLVYAKKENGGTEPASPATGSDSPPPRGAAGRGCQRTRHCRVRRMRSSGPDEHNQPVLECFREGRVMIAGPPESGKKPA